VANVPRRNKRGARLRAGSNISRTGTSVDEFVENNPTPTSLRRMTAEPEVQPEPADTDEPTGG